MCPCPSPSSCWDDSSTPPSLNREPGCYTRNLPAGTSVAHTHPAPLNAWLQSHLQSNISVRHFDIFTLATFTTTIILPQHAGQGDMSSAVVTAPSPLQGPPRLPWLFITSTPPLHHAVRTFCVCALKGDSSLQNTMFYGGRIPPKALKIRL